MFYLVIFVGRSRFVLVEACYMGLPIISSDCKNGPEEILENGKNGILFENNKKTSFIKK